MKALNKKQLNEKLEMLNYVINDSHGAVGSNEKALAAKSISRRALDLMNALEMGLTASAKKMVLDCESQIDRATRYVLTMEAQRG